MELQNITFVDIVSLVGGIAGLLSLGILILQFLLEKPKLHVVVENAYYNQPQPSDSANFSLFHIPIRIENKGRRNTTVHSFTLTFNYQEKQYSPPLQDGRIEVIVIAEDVKRTHLIFALQKRQFVIPEGDIQNAVLEIVHTFDKQVIIIPKITHGSSD
jgi:hypothetical protein